jgi:simple sugar transport system ATP-binding protein
MKMIEVVGLTKRFGPCLANDGVCLGVEQGEIKAIVGENGAGKTTLMNMIYGLIQPTEGQIFVRGNEVHFHSPLDAIKSGLGMVHQHFKLAPSLTVFENILLGIEVRKTVRVFGSSVRLPFIDRKVERERVKKLIEDYKLELDPDAVVADLSIGAKQRVEILKMLYRDVDILILDEPTAVLTPQEVDGLIADLKELKAKGKTLIIITHKLREVMDMSDSVTVIKRGRVVGTVLTKDTNEVELAQMMVGRDVVLNVRNETSTVRDEVAYRAEHLCTTDDHGKEVLHDVSFAVRRGEILGVAGVEGNGQSELMKVLTGLMTVTGGHVYLGDRDVTGKWPDELRVDGIGMIPEDRFAQGLCRDMSITDNCISGYHSFPDVCRFGIFDRKAIVNKRDRLIADYDIRVSDCDGNVSQLSGGNAQKIIIAREFDRDPEVLVASQPTRGVDVGSIEFIHRKLLELKASGKAILLVSSELSEVMCLSDRIIVMFKGGIIGEVNAREVTKERLGLLMAGIRPDGRV